MLDIDPVLLAAQSGHDIKPAVKILSSQGAPDIPFDGQKLLANTGSEYGNSLITHSSGALISAYMYYVIDGYGLRHDYIRFEYSDAGRININYVDFAVSGAGSISTSICEMADGDIGVVFSYISGGSTYIGWKILSPVGAVVNAGGTIFSTSAFISLGNVLKLSSGTYVVVYSWFDGTHYHIFRRTSADFITWSAASECVIAGLTDGNRKYTPFLNQVANNDLWLWFSYVESVSSSGEELTNIYYSISTNGMTSWGAAVKHTTYNTYTAVAKHPFILNADSTTQKLVYTLHKGTLILDSTAAGWCNDGSAQDSSSNISWNSSRRKIYFMTTHAASPSYINSIKEVDMDTWLITNCWSPNTTPALLYTALNRAVHSEGKYYCSLHSGTAYLYDEHGNGAYYSLIVIQVINTVNNTVTRYVNLGNAGLGDKNLTGMDNSTAILAHVKDDDDRLWLIQTTATSTSWGYIDLKNTTSAAFQQTGSINVHSAYGSFSLENNLVMLWETSLRVCVLDGENAGGVMNTFTTGFPSNVRICVYYDNKVFIYNWPDNSNYYGIQIADMATGVVSTEFPTFISPVQAFWIYDMKVTPDGRIAIAGRTYSPNTGFICLYNPSDGTWVAYSSASMPSLSSNGFYSVLPDLMLSDGFILGNNPVQLTCVNLNGSFDQSQYKTGTLLGGVWSWDTAAPLVQGFNDYDAAIALDPDDGGLYAFWTHLVLTTRSIYWDKALAAFDVGRFITRGMEHYLQWADDGAPNKLSVTFSRGNLFDPTNSKSLWNIYLRKGRKLTVKLGLKIGDEDYLVDQGEFFIRDYSGPTYQRGVQPNIAITATDRSEHWGQLNVPATEYIEDYPEAVTQEIILEESNLTTDDIVLPAFENRIIITNQWVGVPLEDIVREIFSRFGYFRYFRMDGKLTARKLRLSGAADIVYDNSEKQISYTPLSKNSSFKNRFIVTGFEKNQITVIQPEERVAGLNGTVGGWGFRKDFPVWFSKDKARTCVNPRIETIESVKGIMFGLMGKIHEDISFIDPDNKYCVITITAPDLRPVLAGALLTLLMNKMTGDKVVSYGPGWTIPFGSLIRNSALMVVVDVLGAVGNYQIDLYAHPVGKMRRQIQSLPADDTELIQSLGLPISDQTESHLVYTVDQAQQVANRKRDLSLADRNRGAVEKGVDLRAEVGDIIQFPHPSSSEGIKLSLSNLKRAFLIPAKPKENGYWKDNIEGRVIS